MIGAPNSEIKTTQSCHLSIGWNSEYIFSLSIRISESIFLYHAIFMLSNMIIDSLSLDSITLLFSWFFATSRKFHAKRKHNLHFSVGTTASGCLFDAFLPFWQADVSNAPVEIMLFNKLLFTLLLGIIGSSFMPQLIESTVCLNNCETISTCSENTTLLSPLYEQQIVFDENVYGIECAKELTEKTKPLEDTGLLRRIVEEVVFLDCIFQQAE